MNRMRRVVPVVVGALVAAGLTALAGPPASAATVPAGFTDALVADVDNPTAIAFTADGRMRVTQQAGRLRVRTAAGQLLTTPALDLAGGRGLWLARSLADEIVSISPRSNFMNASRVVAGLASFERSSVSEP